MESETASADRKYLPAMQVACDGLREVIESLNDPQLRRAALAAKLGLVLKDLESSCYPSVGDGSVLVSGRQAPSGKVEALSEMMRIALEAQPHKAPAVSKPKAIKLSNEQAAAVQIAVDNPVSKAEARAGTGKTTYLIGVSEAMGGRGTYVAYNKDIQRDAEARFPRHVLVRTWHALAYAAVTGPYQRRNKPMRDYRQAEVIELLGLQGESAGSMAYAARATLARFLTTVDERVSFNHVPDEIRLRINRRLRSTGKSGEQALAEVETRCARIATYAQQLWEIAREESNRGALPHDGYLKMWLERGAQIKSDYLLADEAQDFTPVMKAIFDLQACRKVAVGDRYQSIYSFRGAVNAMEQIEAPTSYLTRSFRFGRNIADAANWILDLRGEKQKLKGGSVVHGVVGPVDTNKPYTILARSNAALCVRAAQLATRTKAAVVGGTDEMTSLMKSALGLYTNQRAMVTHPLLSPFETFGALREYAESSSDRECNMMVRMVEEHGGALQAIIASLSSNLVDEGSAHVILSTAHKSKGREWDQVLLEDDFPELYDGNRKLKVEEANLLYVAATRGRVVLQPNDRLAQLNPTLRTNQTANEPVELNMEKRVRER